MAHEIQIGNALLKIDREQGKKYFSVTAGGLEVQRWPLFAQVTAIHSPTYKVLCVEQSPEVQVFDKQLYSSVVGKWISRKSFLGTDCGFRPVDEVDPFFPADLPQMIEWAEEAGWEISSLVSGLLAERLDR